MRNDQIYLGAAIRHRIYEFIHLASYIVSPYAQATKENLTIHVFIERHGL